MVVASGRNKRHLVPKPLHNLKAEDVAVKAQGFVQVCHLQVDVADARLGPALRKRHSGPTMREEWGFP
jgi:hypothetical protein